jgi:hypothetical protein
MHPPEVRAEALALVEAGPKRLRDLASPRDRWLAFINRTDIQRFEPYEYLSYLFTNMSKDIIDLLVGACDRVGVFTRATVDSRGFGTSESTGDPAGPAWSSM